MPLSAGTRLGPYVIQAPLGAGGMGEVYRAEDTRLDRDVAIKILPDSFAGDPDRLMRFTREAKTLASLNHPNIAAIYGIEDRALVMELVEGEDLSAHIARGEMPVEDVIRIARQIADALEAAHEQGIIHRDLKPANIKLRDDGTVKVLDFGLAKALAPEGASAAAGGPPHAVNSPTFTSPAMTQMGLILGTAAYMAPEQAKGKTVDRRADVWAFGVVVHEMLTGKPLFAAADVTDTMVAVLTREPDFTELPARTPLALRRLLARCLAKDRRARLDSMGAARLELEDAAAHPNDVGAAASAPAGGWRGPLLWAFAGGGLALVIAGAATRLLEQPAPAGAIVRTEIAFPSTPLFISGNRSFAIDPSGTELVFTAVADDKVSHLFRRRLADDAAVAIAGTSEALGPFFSPDGKWLAFTQKGRLKRIPAAGGGAVDLGDVAGAAGGTFTPDGSLILNPTHGEGLYRSPPASADRTPLTTVARDKGESGHHWPHILPDGKHVLFTTELDGKSYSDARIEVVSLENGERRLLLEGGADARYVPSGHLLYWREGDVWSVPFDLASLQVTGSASAVLRGVMMIEPNGHAQFAVADNGTVAYLTGRDPQEEHTVMLVSRVGVARPLTTERRAFEAVTVSPDARYLAATIVGANDSLWTMEIGRSSVTRITFEAENSRPVWSPDGTRLAFLRYRGGEARRMFVMPADGSTPPEMLRDSGGRAESAESWSRTGILAFTRSEPAAGTDIWVMDVDGQRQARPFLATRFNEFLPRFSPDGKWLAYTSDESGRIEVYVRPFPGPGQKRLVSSDGGTEPRWRADGRELFYRNGDTVVAVDVTAGAALTVSLPRVLFKGAYLDAGGSYPTWDVMPDGQSFLLIRSDAQPRTAISLVQNWFQELQKK